MQDSEGTRAAFEGLLNGAVDAPRRRPTIGVAENGADSALALVSEAMVGAFRERWTEGGTLSVRWRSPAMHPVTVTARAALKGTKDGVATYLSLIHI